MGISIDPTLPDRDWSGMVRPTLEAIAKLIVKDYFGATFKAHDASKEFRRKEETLEQRVWTLWRESLAIALPAFFETAGLTRRPDDKELARLLVEILEGAEVLCTRKDVQLTAHDLKCPHDFELYQALREKLPGWARELAPDHLRDDDHLRRRLDRAFVKGFHRARFEGGSHFDEIRDYLSGDGSEAIERQDHWLRYYEWLRAEVEDRPMFGQEADGPTLQDIFVPLRCTWRERPRERHGREGEDGDKRTTVHVRWLLDELQAWLDKADKKDVLRVVTGGPGCGKSSTAKVFSRDVALADRFNVFVVPLQGLDVSREIDAVVSDYLDDARHNSSCLPESPIDWIRHDPKPLLLIFDGLDEVAREDGGGLEVTRQFLESLRVWLGRVNGGGADLKVMALALGRPQAAEEAASKIGGLDGACLLYAEPLCALDEERLKRGSHREIVVNDPGKLAAGDYRRTFWDGYARFDERYREAEPAVLDERGLNDLTVEPLLLYLLMYSGFAGENWPEAKENRNRIYEAIFAKVHERDRKEKDGLAVDSREDFFTLMECLGLAAWMGGGRTGSDEDFEIIRDEIYAPDRKKDFEGLDRARLKNVAVQFYTQHGSREQPGYAFIHKSFGEYLTARALIKASKAWCEDYGKRNKWGSFAEDWFRLTGGQRITREISAFMIDEARLQMKPRSRDDAYMHQARELVDQLCEVATLTLRDGFPAHRISPACRGEANWRRRELFQRSAEASLYMVIRAWAEVGYPFDLISKDEAEGGWTPGPIKVSWQEDARTPAVAMLGRLRDQWAIESIASELFSRWDFSSQTFGVIDLLDFELSGANLRKADLSETNLSGANLHGADLSGAKLGGANLQGAKLSEANLNAANLSSELRFSQKTHMAITIKTDLIWAQIYKANLSEANLSGAQIYKADLSEANLNEANLNETDLSGANLSGASLHGAKLREANLNEADLSGADCSRVRIQSDRLQPAVFPMAANLTQEQIEKANGDSETRLPDGMQRPAHWLEDS